MENKLTAKQKEFCEYYVELNNGNQAAIKAGYSEKTARMIASENLTKPYIKRYIAKLRKQKEADFYYSRSMSFEKLEKAQELALNRIITKTDSAGEVIEIPSPDIQAFLKAEELKGKLQGLYIEHQTTETNINIQSMGTVTINNNKLELKLGQEPPKETDD